MAYDTDLKDHLEKICQKKLKAPSKFKDYDRDAVVFFCIGGVHGYEQKRPEGTRNIIPGQTYPDSGLNAQLFELEMAHQKTMLLDMTPNRNSLGFSMRNAILDWNNHK